MPPAQKPVVPTSDSNEARIAAFDNRSSSLIGSASEPYTRSASKANSLKGERQDGS
jgi:hypothetical protein